MSKRKPIEADWYDYPQYYDMGFREDTPFEADFVEQACRKYMDRPARRLLEPACGAGRLVTELAVRGYEPVGFDLSDKMLRYAERRLKRRELQAELFKADMTEFKLPGRKKADAAYCLIDSFRHLLTEEAAVSHLRSVARSLRKGGLYILGLHLLPLDADENCIERWSARYGRTKVSVTLRVIDTDRPQRIEKLRISVLARVGERETRIRTEFPLRMYTATQMMMLFDSADCFDLLDIYDFNYDIDDQFQFHEDTIGDTVFVLQKKN